MLGFALMWLGIAAALTVRTARSGEGLPFAMTWWSFTFPVGTVVTGTTQLSVHTGLIVLGWLACAIFVFLVTAWLTVATRTLAGLRTGELLPPAQARPAPVVYAI